MGMFKKFATAIAICLALSGYGWCQELSEVPPDRIDRELQIIEAIKLHEIRESFPREFTKSQNPFKQHSLDELKKLREDGGLSEYAAAELLETKRAQGVIGTDDRHELAEVRKAAAEQADPFLTRVVDQSKSVCLVIWSDADPDKVKEEGLTLEEVRRLSLCPSERFHDQPSRGDGTGFVIGEDVMATAGHCIPEDLSELYFVFDYTLEDGNTRLSFTPEQIYHAEDLHKVVIDAVGADFALVKVDRVIDRAPLAVNSNPVVDDTKLYMLGHPSGLPMKFTTGESIRSKPKAPFFRTSLDAFHGNSGSPVFDWESGEVVGILVRGDKDYTDYVVGNCRKVIRYGNGPVRGEDVTRVQAFERYLKGAK